MSESFLALVRTHQFDDDYEGALNLINGIEGTNDWCLQCHLERAVCLINLDRDEEAIGDLSKYILSNPSNAAAVHKRGMVYSHLANHSLAKEDFMLATRLCPENVDFLMDLADEYQLLEEFDNQLMILNRILKVNPEHELGLYCRGLYFLDHKFTQDALEDFEVLCLKYPANADYHFSRARCLAILGRKADSLEAIKSALILDPDNIHYKEGLRRAQSN